MSRIVNLTATSILHGYAFQQFQQQLSNVQHQALTGNKLQYASDDPLLAQKLQYLQNSIDKNQQIQTNYLIADQRLEELSTVLGSAEGADGILGILNDIRDLMRSNLAPTDTAAVAARRAELRALTSQLVDALNQRAGDDNRYLFGGTVSSEKPFNLDLSKVPLEVTYAGNYDVASMNISDSIQEALTMVGASLVGASSTVAPPPASLDAGSSILQSIAYFDAVLSDPSLVISGSLSTLTAGNAYQNGMYSKPPFAAAAGSANQLNSGSLTLNFNVAQNNAAATSIKIDIPAINGIQSDTDFQNAINAALANGGLTDVSASIVNGVISFSYGGTTPNTISSLSLASVTASYDYANGGGTVNNQAFTTQLGFQTNQFAQNTSFGNALSSIQNIFQNGQNSAISLASQIGFRQNELQSIANLSENLGLQYQTQYNKLGIVEPAQANAQYMYLMGVYNQILALSAQVGQTSLFSYL